jgi:Cu+-exporting ATPase
MATVNIRVEGMVCQSCVQNIEQNLSKKDGVSRVAVSLEEKLARVTYDAAVTNPQELADEIEDLGFEAMLPSVAASSGASRTCTIGVGGMTCHSCVSLIEGGLGEIAGVESAAVSLEKEQAVIVFNPSMAGIEDFKTAIDDMGFIVKTPTDKEGDVAEDDDKVPLIRQRRSRRTPRRSRRSRPKRTGGKGLEQSFREVSMDTIGEEFLLRAQFNVSGLNCASCVAKVEKHLKKKSGVHSARVALLAGKAEVKYNPEKISPEIIAQEVNSLGFTAEYLPEASSGGGTILELKVNSEPMQLKINQVLMGKEGIIGVTVDKHGNARVEYDNTAVGPRDILQMVEKEGFAVTVQAKKRGLLNHGKGIRKWAFIFTVGLIVGIPVFIIKYTPYRHTVHDGNRTRMSNEWPRMGGDGPNTQVFILFLLATLVQVCL